MSNELTITSTELTKVAGCSVQLMKDTIAKGLTNEEFRLFAYTCSRLGLDPFQRQLYPVKRWDSKLGRESMVIQIGIDGYRLIAERTKRYAPGKETAFEYKDGRLYSATAYVKKFMEADKSWHEVSATVFFDEYAAKDKNGNLTGMWRDKPCMMLAKCLPYRAMIQTDLGMFRIGEIVKNKMNVKVRSINLKSGLEEWKPIVGWVRNDGTQLWQRIVVPNKTHGHRPILTTPEHLIYTETGWKEAQNIKIGEMIAVASSIPSNNQRQVLLGSLLGDGTLLTQKGRNGCPKFSEAHSVNQLAYLEWKCRNLSTFDPVLRFSIQHVKGSEHEVVIMNTKSSPYFYQMSDKFYKNRKKIVSREILNEVDDLAVAVWIMDDGSLKKTGHGDKCNPSLRLYTCCFENQDDLVSFFEKKYKVYPKILRESKNPYLAFGVMDTKKLLDYLSLYIEFDDENNNKRWIARDIEQGIKNSFCYVPCIKNEIYDCGEKQGKYDITVKDNHNFLYNNILVHNCSESAALRRAFPSELSGVYTKEEMEASTEIVQSPEPFGPKEATAWLDEKSKTYDQAEILDYIESVAKFMGLDKVKIIEVLYHDDKRFVEKFTLWKEGKTKS